MSEPELLQRQRKILSVFRQADAQRTQVEAQANSQHQTALQDASDRLNEVRTTADKHLNEAHQALRDAESSLSKVGRQSILSRVKSPSIKGSTGAAMVSPGKELASRAHIACEAARNIETFLRLRESRKLKLAELRQLNLSRSMMISTIVVGFGGFMVAIALENYLQWVFIICGFLSMIALVIGDNAWNFNEKEASKKLRGRYFWLLVILPAALFVAPIIAIYHLVKSYSDSRLAIEQRHPGVPDYSALVRDIQNNIKNLTEAVEIAEVAHDLWLKEAENEYQQSKAKTDLLTITRLASAQKNYEEVWSQVHKDSITIFNDAGLIGASWGDQSWHQWMPAEEQSIGTNLRVGQLIEEGRWHNFTMPALVNIISGRNFLIRSSSLVNDQAIGAIQCLMLRMLASVSPGKLRFIFMDPIGLGSSVAPLLSLADYDEAMIGGKAWTEPKHIEEQLASISEHMELVIQKFLRDEYSSIDEYNTEAGEVAEPYKVLVIINFPINFTDVAARRLASIALNGPRCGVYTIIHMDMEQKLPYGFDSQSRKESLVSQTPQARAKEGLDLSDLERRSTVISWNGQRFAYEDRDFNNCRLQLDTPPSDELIDHIVDSIGSMAKEASRVEVPFDKVIAEPELWWQGNSQHGLQIPLGRSGARKTQCLELGQGTAQHALVAGQTGSGKSTLFHAIITAVSLTYHPNEVILYLIDFKKGVEFKTYAVHDVPHIHVVAIESEREFGLSVLQGLNTELGRRGELFRSVAVDEISDYRQKTGKQLPRILLIVDEFQEFFVEDDAIAASASQILDRLVRQGRAFGMHVILGSQTLAGAYKLAQSTIDQMAIRIALQCTEADSRLILSEDNPAARLIRRPGEAYYNAASGLIEGNNLFQVAWLPDQIRDGYLQRIIEMSNQKNYTPPQPQIVFEGNTPAKLEANKIFHDLLTGTIELPPSQVIAWLGEPIAIADPIATHFRKQAGSNLLMVGQDSNMAAGMLLNSLIMLAAQHKNDNAQIYVLDLMPADAPYKEMLHKLAEVLPQQLHQVRSRELPQIMGKIAAVVKERIEREAAGWSDQSEGSVYLVIYGLQRARDLRQDEMSFYSPTSHGDEGVTTSPAQQFATILQEGPEVGIHTLVWCDTYSSLTRTLDRRTLRDFEMRVVLQMGAEDSNNLIDSPTASKLGKYRALYSNPEEGRLDKFRPYSLPTQDWLEWAGERLCETAGGYSSPQRQSVLKSKKWAEGINLDEKGGKIIMPYTAEISRVNPGCFVFLIDQSGSMADEFGGEISKQKSEGVADAINRLLQNLVIKCTKSEGVRDYFEVGVIGYGASVGPAFSGSLGGRNVVPISEVAMQPAQIDERTHKVYDDAGGILEQPIKFPVWFYPVANGGTPMCEAMERTYNIVQDWVQRYATSYPPVVINITDGESTDGDPTGIAEKIMNLSTQDGKVLVFNCHISSMSAAPIMFPDTELGLPDEFARLLFNMSSVLPDNLCKVAQSEGFQAVGNARGFAFNADLISVISFLDIGTRPSSLQLR